MAKKEIVVQSDVVNTEKGGKDFYQPSTMNSLYEATQLVQEVSLDSPLFEVPIRNLVQPINFVSESRPKKNHHKPKGGLGPIPLSTSMVCHDPFIVRAHAKIGKRS